MMTAKEQTTENEEKMENERGDKIREDIEHGVECTYTKGEDQGIGEEG